VAEKENGRITRERNTEMKEHTLDCLGEACPVPLMKTEKKINSIEIGDVLIVQIDHSCAMKNVPEWARNQGYNVEIDEVADGEWEVVIEKTK
jgi:TusA-related sulfurtransferase